MPKVTDAHLEQRRQAILDAALLCFARDGFHATSMARVIEQSGVSAGSVYRYFPSKQHLIVAAAEAVLERIHDALDMLEREDPDASPITVCRTLFEHATRGLREGDTDLSVVALSVWQEASRDPHLRALLAERYGAVRDYVERSVRRWRDAGHLAAGADVQALAAAIFGMLPGMIVQRHLLGGTDADRAFAAMENVLEDAARVPRERAR